MTLDDVKKAMNNFITLHNRYNDPVHNPGVTWQQVDNARHEVAVMMLNDPALKQQAEQAFPIEE